MTFGDASGSVELIEQRGDVEASLSKKPGRSLAKFSFVLEDEKPESG